MRRQWFAPVLVAIAVAVAVFAVARACDGGGADAPTPSGATPTPELITEATRERDGLELHLSVDEETYDVGEEVIATAIVTSNRGTPVNYESVVPGVTPFRLDVISELGGEQPLEPEDSGPPDSGSLDPGGQLELTAGWDQQLDIDQDPIQAPPGGYSIRATFTSRSQGQAAPIEVQTAVTFELEGAEPVAEPLDVLATAIATDELKAWMEGRSESVVCAYPPRGLFYQGFISSEQAAETFDFIYESQVAGGLPVCGIGTDGDAWRLNFYSAAGPPPSRMNMLFDLNDGAFIRVEEVTPPTSPFPPP